MPAVVAGGREFLGWTAAIVAIGLAVASGNPWALLPLAPLLLIIQIEDWPRWIQEPAARLLQAALYASLGVCLFIATDFVFGNAVSERTYRTVETGILECREWLDYLTDLRFMLPAIVVAGGISWLAADRLVRARCQSDQHDLPLGLHAVAVHPVHRGTRRSQDTRRRSQDRQVPDSHRRAETSGRAISGDGRRCGGD
jgi:hypothetical protein